MGMTNKTLNKLNISYNYIGEEGGKALAEMGMTNKTLNKLNISNNYIGTEGGKALVKMLETNTTLKTLYLSGNDIRNDLSSTITAFVACNHTLWKQQKEIMERSDDALSYYINGYVATPSPTTTDDSNNTHWTWTENAWKAINSTDGRITKLLLNCLKMVNIEANKASLKRLAEYDETDGNLLLIIAATKTHPTVINLLKFFIEDVKVDIDCTERSGRTIRAAAMGSDNKESAAWARTYGTYLGRYRIEGGNGLNSDPVHESDTCFVHFATDMKISVKDSKHHVALKIMFNETNFKRELKARISIKMSDIKPDDDISEKQNKYESEHVITLHRYHNDDEFKNENKCWCLVLAKGSKSISQIIHTERIAGIKTDKLINCGVDFAKAIQHMHEKNMIHADIKPRNVIRDITGDFKLIDLDASVEIGEKLINKKKSTAFMSPELAKAEFFSNESVEDLEEQCKEKFDELKQLKYGDDVTLDEITEEVKELKRKIKVCNQEWNDTIKANKSIDIWGFG